jgi:hypothetical protein
MKSLFNETCIGQLRLRNRLVRSVIWEQPDGNICPFREDPVRPACIRNS